MTDADLRRMVGLDPKRPGPARARLVEYGVPVWAIVGHLGAIGGGDDPVESARSVIDQVAADYQISSAAVAAALLYYRDHRAAIDTRLASNGDDS